MPLKHVHGKLMSPDSLWARRKANAETAAGDETTQPQSEQVSSKMNADDEFEENDINVDAVLRRADRYATAEDVSGEDEETDEEFVDDDGDYEDEADEDAPETDEQVANQPVAEADDDESYEDDDESDEDEDEIVTEDDEDIVDSTVENDDNDVDEDLPMADKKMSMSDHVRREIEKRKTSGDSLRGVDIVNAMERRGINVSAAQVSQLLKKAGVAGGKAGRKPRAAVESGEETTSRAANKKKPPAGPRTARPARVISPRARDEQPQRAASKVPAPAAVTATDPGLLAAAQGYFEACGHDMHAAQKFLRAAEAVHNALSEFE